LKKGRTAERGRETDESAVWAGLQEKAFIGTGRLSREGREGFGAERFAGEVLEKKKGDVRGEALICGEL